MFAQDYFPIKEDREGFIQYNQDSCTKFIAYITAPNTNFHYRLNDLRRIKNYERYILGPERMGEIPIDIALEPVADLCGTVFSAIQFALFGGASKIFLVGFDCNISHFFEKDVNSMNLSGQYPSWLRIKDFQEDYFE